MRQAFVVAVVALLAAAASADGRRNEEVSTQKYSHFSARDDPTRCVSWKRLADMTGSDLARIPKGTEVSPLGVYKITDAGGDKALYIKDDSPEFNGQHHWQSKEHQAVQCATSAAHDWRLTGSVGYRHRDGSVCDPIGVGNHICGVHSGWIMWHNGATYGDGPCKVPGANSYGRASLEHLFACVADVQTTLEELRDAAQAAATNYSAMAASRAPPQARVFISEYVEGTGHTKAIELYNPTSKPVVMDGLRLQWHHNGYIFWKQMDYNLRLDGRSIPASGTYTVCRLPTANQPATVPAAGKCDEWVSANSAASLALLHTGDDAIELLFNDAVVDVVGKPGQEADSWQCWHDRFGRCLTRDQTLRRKPSVHRGVTAWDADQWQLQPADDVSGLGSHTVAPPDRACPANAEGPNCHCRRSFYGSVHPNGRGWIGGCAPMEAGERNTLNLVHKPTCASGTVSYVAASGTLYLSASKCVSTKNFCVGDNPMPATHSCSSSRPVVRSVELTSLTGSPAQINLHDDGVLSFGGAACVTYTVADQARRGAGGITFRSQQVYDPASKRNKNFTAGITLDGSSRMEVRATRLLVEGTEAYGINPFDVCGMNQCSCPNGVGVYGSACASQGAPLCKECKCSSSHCYHLADGNRRCAENVCTCANGTPKAGAQCTEHGELCAKCDTDFFLSGKVCRAHRVCSATEHETVAATGTSDRECAANSLCHRNPDQYEAKPPTATSDRVCTSHTPCTSDQYEVTPPTDFAARTCSLKQCVCPNGQATVGDACPGHMGTFCSGCNAGFYVDQNACHAVTLCAQTEHETKAPTAKSNRECAANSQCHIDPQQFEKAAPTRTSDRECESHVECTADQYVVSQATNFAPRVCARKQCHCQHGTATSGSACPKHGNPKCSGCDTAAGYHLNAAQTQCDVNICRCLHGTIATGSACSTHGATICVPGSCNAGFHQSGADCVANTVCSPTEHETQAPTALSDRRCTANTQCAAHQFESTAPTRITDRVCLSHTPCTAAQFERVAPTDTTDRECATKQCTCANGTPASGADCTANAAAQCMSCDAAYYLDSGACHISPIHGAWGQFSAWSQCSADCGGGKQYRTRACDSPAPAHGGNACAGENKEWQNCNEQCCPAHTDSCTCDGPSTVLKCSQCDPPTKDGCCTGSGSFLACSGANSGAQCASVGTIDCKGRCVTSYGSCAAGKNLVPTVHGGWSEWSAWDGAGQTQTRTRSCNSPKPANGGNQCVGDSVETRTNNPWGVISIGSTSSTSIVDGVGVRCSKWSGSLCEMPEFYVPGTGQKSSGWYRMYTNGNFANTEKGKCDGRMAKLFCALATGGDTQYWDHTWGPKMTSFSHSLRFTVGYAGRECPNTYFMDHTIDEYGLKVTAYPQYTDNRYYDHIRCNWQ